MELLAKTVSRPQQRTDFVEKGHWLIKCAADRRATNRDAGVYPKLADPMGHNVALGRRNLRRLQMAKLAQFAEAIGDGPPQTSMVVGMAWHGCRPFFRWQKSRHQSQQKRMVRRGAQDVLRSWAVFHGRLDCGTKANTTGRRVVGDDCLHFGRSLRCISSVELLVAKRPSRCAAIDGSAAGLQNSRPVLGETVEPRLSGCRISSHFSSARCFR